MKAFLYYFPRVLSVAIVAFFLLMSFDEPILSVGFLMHNIPTIIITIVAILAWKSNLFGALFFLILGITSFFFFKTYKDPIVFLIVTMPFVLISGAAFYNFFTKNEKHKN